MRKLESSNTVAEEVKRDHFLETKKIESHVAHINDEDFITVKEIPSLE